MASRYRLAAILFFSICFGFCFGCEVYDVAVYKVKLYSLIQDESDSGEKQLAQVFGQSHNISYALYHIGETSKPLVRDFIQYGNIEHLMKEGDEEPKVYDQFTYDDAGEKETDSVLFVDGGHSLVSIISRYPTRDWFVGVDSLDLCVRSTWLEDVTLDLEPLISGGNSNDQDEPVQKLSHRSQNFYSRNPKFMHPVAKVEFTRVKEYSTKDLNNLVRKELTNEMEPKQKLKPSKQQFVKYNNIERVTKNPFEQLKDLEEEPVGTPRPNNPDNNVVVVTKAPDFRNSEEIDTNLKNMDDVVLAVANGKKLGLGKHLPRHFKSRLHHAVNKHRGKHCKVSGWSNWSSCPTTDPCNEQTRTRTVVQEKKGDGRDCPSLVQKQYCGRCVRGDGDDLW